MLERYMKSMCNSKGQEQFNFTCCRWWQEESAARRMNPRRGRTATRKRGRRTTRKKIMIYQGLPAQHARHLTVRAHHRPESIRWYSSLPARLSMTTVGTASCSSTHAILPNSVEDWGKWLLVDRSGLMAHAVFTKMDQLTVIWLRKWVLL